MVEKVNIETSITTTSSEKSEAASQSFTRIRNVFVNETAVLSELVPHLRPTIQKHATSMLGSISDMSEEVGAEMGSPSDMLSVESLYKPLVATEEVEQPTMLRLYTLLNEYGQHLSTALAHFDDVATRENEMIAFGRLVYELDYVTDASENFKEVNTALKIALTSQRTKPYTGPQVIALTKVVDRMRKNIGITDSVLDEILDILDKHFNLSGPFAEVELSF